MIQAKDLRIGNWVMYDNKIFEVDTISMEFPTLNTIEFGIGVVKWDKLNPIPLTEELLIKCGFKKINHIHGYSFWAMGIKGGRPKIDIYENYTLYMGYMVNHIKYLHQLQNLIFALSGEELEINF